MKFLHTADWHLGKTLNEKSLLEDQAYILDQMLRWIEAHPVDALFISGDLYDRSLPPKEAVSLLDRFLRRCVLELKVPVLLIAGNHDSPERISYASSLLEGAGLFVRGFPDVPMEPVVFGDVHIYLWPYTELSTLRLQYGLEGESLSEILKSVFSSSIRDPQATNLLLAHEYVLGGRESDSERPLMMGKASALGSDVFSDFDAVFLGHLHRHQRVSGNISYSGSLLKYSKSEAGTVKAAQLIEIQGKAVHVAPVHFPVLRDLRIIRGTFSQLLKEESEDLIYAELEDKSLIPDAMSRLKKNYPNALALEYVALESRTLTPQSSQPAKERSLLRSFTRFYEAVREEEMPEDYLAASETIARKLEER